MECTNNTIENDSNLTITETDFSENVTNLNTAMDLADIITGRKKCSELTRNEKYHYNKNHFTPTKNNQLYQLYQEKVTKKGETFTGLLQSGKVRGGKGHFHTGQGKSAKVREFCEKSGKDFRKSGKFF